MPSSEQVVRFPAYHFLVITDRDLVKKARALIDVGAPFAVRSPNTFKYQDDVRRTFAKPYDTPDEGRSALRVLLDSWGSMDAIGSRARAGQREIFRESRGRRRRHLHLLR